MGTDVRRLGGEIGHRPPVEEMFDVVVDERNDRASRRTIATGAG
jgi:hypothetical protein